AAALRGGAAATARLLYLGGVARPHTQRTREVFARCPLRWPGAWRHSSRSPPYGGQSLSSPSASAGCASPGLRSSLAPWSLPFVSRWPTRSSRGRDVDGSSSRRPRRSERTSTTLDGGFDRLGDGAAERAVGHDGRVFAVTTGDHDEHLVGGEDLRHE